MASTKTALEKITSALPDALRSDLHQRIELEKQNLIDALLDLAKGAWYEDTHFTKDNVPFTVRIYQKLPDKEVAQYLLNQVIGKPKENVQIQGRVNFIMDQ
jgi:hypothetical protein